MNSMKARGNGRKEEDKKSNNVHTIRGVPVHFPFSAYPPQLVFMDKIMEALLEGKSALLESPTGTGKTLCFLSALLAYNEWRGDQPRTLYYASRTHSQLGQVLKQIPKTAYTPIISVLGSRDHLCIHPKVKMSSSATKAIQCRKLVSAQRCEYYANTSLYERPLLDKEGFSVSPDLTRKEYVLQDIEELVSEGKRLASCPFYTSQARIADSEIVFLPYSYLLDKSSRDSMKLNLRGSIVFFDEAHNLAGNCESSSAIILHTRSISIAKDQLDALEALSKQMDGDFEIPARVRSLISVTLARILITDIPKELNLSHLTINFISDLFEAVVPAMLNGLEMAKDIRLTMDFIANSSNDGLSTFSDLHTALKAFQAIVSLYSSLQSDARLSCDVAIYWDETRTFRYLHIAKLGSTSLMTEIQSLGVHSLVLASATLGALDNYERCLRIKFPIQLINDHVVPAHHVFARIIPCGPMSITLNSTFSNRKRPEYIIELGRALINLARIIPKGMIVFFSSYDALNSAYKFWEKSVNGTLPILDQMKKFKHVFVERKAMKGEEFSQFIRDYKSSLTSASDKSGSIIFAVCRGRLSEGIDFSDDLCRAVIVCGIPFSSPADPTTAMRSHTLKSSDYKQWYNEQALIAVNQCIGRVIRHSRDYGAILLLEPRFDSLKGMLPKWVQTCLKQEPTFGQVLGPLRVFYKTHGAENEPQAKLPGLDGTLLESLSSLSLSTHSDENSCPSLNPPKLKMRPLAKQPMKRLSFSSPKSLAIGVNPSPVKTILNLPSFSSQGSR